MADEEKIVSLTYVVDPKSQAAINLVASMNEKLTASMKSVASAAEATSGIIFKSTDPLTKQEASLKRIENGLNPLKRAYEGAANQLLLLIGIMNQEVGTSEPRRAAVERAKASYDALNAKVQLLGKALKDSAGEERFATAEHVKLANAAQILKDRLDPLAASERVHAQAIREVDKMLKAGVITQKEHTQALALPRERLLGMASAQAQVGVNSRLMSYALTNMSFQINDVVSGLVMGQQPFRIFAQQAGQFFQIFQQIGWKDIPQFFKQFGEGILSAGSAVGGWLVTRVGLAVTSLTVLATSFALVLARSTSNELQLRRFDSSLRNINTTTNTSSIGLQKLAYDLRAVGLSGADAEKGILGLSRNLSVNLDNPNAVRNLAQLGINVGAKLGIGEVAGIEKVSEAIKDQGDAIVKLGLETKAFTTDEAARIAISIQRGNRIEEVGIAIKLLSDRLVGEQEKHRTGFSKFFDSVGNAWNTLANKISDTSTFSAIDKLFAHMAENLKFITETGSFSRNSMIGRIFPDTDKGILAIEARRKQIARNITPPGGVTLETGGVLQKANVFGKNIDDLDSEFASRLDLWLSSLSELDKTSVKISSAFRTGAHPSKFSKGGFGAHNLRLGVDLAGLSKAAAATLEDFGLHQTVVGDWGHVEPIEIPKASVASKALRRESWNTFLESNQFRTGLRTNTFTNQSVDDTNVVKKSTVEITEQQKQIDLLNRGYTDSTRNTALWGIQQQASTAFTQKYNEVLGSTKDSTIAWDQANIEFNKTRDIALIQLNKDIQLTNIEISGKFKAAEVAKTGVSAMLEQDAKTQALIKSRQTGISVEEAYKQIIQSSASEAVRGAAEQNAAQIPVIAGQLKLAEAVKIGAQAEHDVRVENEANIIVQRALDVEKVKGTEITAGLVKQLKEQALAQILVKEAASNSIRVTRELNQSADTIEILRLQIGLQNQTSEEINRQVVLLQKKQELERDTTGLNKEQKDAILTATDAIQKQNIELANSNREWQRLESGIRSIADTIGSGLTRSIEDAFNGKKVKDWGETVRSTLSSILTKIIDFTLIKPATGTVLSALGFTGLASSFGTFGSSSGSTTSGTLTAGSTITDSSGNTFTLSNAADVLSIGSSTSSLFGGPSLFGGAGEFLFGATEAAVGSAVEAGIAGVTTEGLLGSGGIASTLGLTSSFLSWAVPVAGIALGALSLFGGGLFKSKPSNKASGGNVDLGSGIIDAVSSGGVSANDSTSKSILDDISDFTKSIKNLTGGTLTGSINVQAGSRDGIKLAGIIGSWSGEAKFATAQEAIDAAELQIVKELEGLSPTFEKVFDSLTDSDDIDKAIDFIKIYDNLKDAADSAFSSIDTDVKKIGPFEDALTEIGDIFDDLVISAEEFGLSLDPINAALEEAEKRLVKDWDILIQDAILAIEDPIQLLVEEEKKLGKNRVQEAEAIGASLIEVNRYNALALDDIWENQTLNLKQLADDLKTGSSSGLSISKQIEAANDNFQAELKLVKGGSLSAIADLVTTARDLFDLSETAYGNAPKTEKIRSEILDAVDDVLENRSFASGTSSTPEGWIRVGENGPEWMRQGGGNQILSSGQTPNSSSLISELQAVRQLLESGNIIARGVGIDTGKKLDKVAGGLDKKVLQEPGRQKVA